MYKIRRKTDGLFSDGGMSPRFSNKGKSWKHRGHVTSHLSQFNDRQKNEYYKDCEIVKFEVIETETETVDALEWSPLPNTIRAKELEEIRRLEYERECRKKEIKRLENKLKTMKQKG